MNDFLYNLVDWCFDRFDDFIDWLDKNATDIFDEIDEFLKIFD